MIFIFFFLIFNFVYSITPINGLDRLLNASKEYYINKIWMRGLDPEISKPYQETYDIFDDNDLNNGIGCFRIPSIIITNSDRIIVFSEARMGTCRDCEITGIVSKISENKGKSWGKLKWIIRPENINNISGTNRGANPTTIYDSINDQIILHFSRGGTYNNKTWDCIPSKSTWQIISNDGGMSWSKPKLLNKYLGNWVGILPGPGAGIMTSQGRYVFTGHYGTAERKYGSVITYYSDDNGTTYHTSDNNLSRMDESSIVEVSKNNLLINMRNDEFCRCRAQSFSYDNGKSWGEIQYDLGLSDPVCQGDITKLDDYLIFSNPDMKYARSNLTLSFRKISSINWNKIRITDEFSFADYSVIGNKIILINETRYLLIVWGSCSKPLPFRIWCLDDRNWNIKLSIIPMTDFFLNI